MKPFKTISYCLAAVSLFLITSCSKTVDEQAGTGRDSEQLNGVNAVQPLCGNFIGLRMNTARGGYFWVNTEANKQDFTGNNFVPKNLVEVTAVSNGNNPSIVGAVVPYYDNTSEGLGVSSNVDVTWQNWGINNGEVLKFKLGTDYLPLGFLWYGFDLNLNATKNSNGIITLYRNGSLQETITFSGATYNNKNFSVIHRATDLKRFDEIHFTATSGSYRVNGFGANKNAPWLPPVRFYLVDLPNNVFLNTNISATPFINAIIDGVLQGPGNRQLRNSTIAPGLPGSGEFNMGTKTWLDLKTFNNENPLIPYQLTYQASRIGISSTGLDSERGVFNPNEVLSIKAGVDLPAEFKIFRLVEIRVATAMGPQPPLEVKLLRNGVQLGPLQYTNGLNAANNVFSGPSDFDEVQVRGTGNVATIGRPGNIIRLYRGCQP